MRVAELRQERVADQNGRLFGYGALGFLIIALVLYFLTQYVVKPHSYYRDLQRPVSEVQTSDGPPPIASPDAPEMTQGQLGAGGLYDFSVPADYDSTIYFT